MDYYFSPCITNMYQHRYVDFLLEHYTELKLTYPFQEAFSYIVSPLLMEGVSILCFDNEEETAGAFSYIYGTGEHDYTDRHIVQIQVAFIVERHRRTGLFAKALQYLLEHIEADESKEQVTELRFWTACNDYNRRLFEKFAERYAMAENECGQMDGYRVLISELRTYLDRLQTRALV
ncbi:hypothetical protein SAMN04488542_103256 [Fontibacillus panacisegetis]|uniref:Acetyltransferase (GNAT) family protein n=1 Tax=Fontibacillus panacisegetis TaxID=670482 RepID=A0A1G7GYK3_9BACL|nr:hypothetical protein [Fontibacillus panacisegetis]SDE93217.1 hypothetical protein SAMN04488542_103256 [Fontibacillus panacisegetis]